MITSPEKNIRFRLQYVESDRQSGDTEIDMDITFENPKTIKDLVKKLNTFLHATGHGYLYIEEKSQAP